MTEKNFINYATMFNKYHLNDFLKVQNELLPENSKIEVFVFEPKHIGIDLWFYGIRDDGSDTKHFETDIFLQDTLTEKYEISGRISKLNLDYIKSECEKLILENLEEG